MSGKESIWAKRFLAAALLQGLILFVITAVLLAFNLTGTGYTSPAAIIASGSAGTWLLVGYLGYLIFPVMGTGLSAFFYHYIESIMNRPYTGNLNLLAWGHLILGNVGIGLGFIVMIWGGYGGGSAMVSTALGGLGQTAYYAHVHFLGPIAEPIAYLFALGAIGPLLGGIGYFLQFRKSM